MSAIYDNWERLVDATLRREQLWQLFHSQSRTPSVCSTASDFSHSSQLSDFPFDFSNSSSWYQQNRVFEVGIYGWGYNANDLEAKSHNAKEFVPGDIFVNGKPLTSRELIMLLRGPHPPKKLKPGNYWYDKHTGFWGKQGQRPSQIISAHLNLGGFLEPHASNGNTLVYVNGREITKVELRVLRAVGVKCNRDTHFWIYEDGSYLEEAGLPTRGSIWDKAGMKLLCSLLSLPFPRNSSNLSLPECIERTAIQKILLMGCSGSGTSTIFKQAVFLYKDIPFLEDELEQIKLLIQSNIYSYIRILLEGHKQLEEEILKELRESRSTDEHGLAEFADASDKTSIYPFGPRLKAFSDWIFQFTESSSSQVFSASFILATAPLIEELWRNPTFQETFMQRSELQRLQSAANYFLERAVHIFKPDYEPSNMDILCAEQFPSSLSYVDFSFPPPRDDEFDIWAQQDFKTRYQLIRPDGPGDNEMPFDMFGDAQIVIFCVSLCDYDQLVVNDSRNSVNKMIYNTVV
ncbi:hypothetical protein CDL12_07722 [Handroanthus impetiginosus]|uniref:Uncharacterized protein n=1 Tax=Handroanthus impetiginosus TaxID=429701 RepID=A0A2G9HQ03_9LAMI|nr:hypothetical protein CDL12_07722 [Handroanthus impetiginosus]